MCICRGTYSLGVIALGVLTIDADNKICKNTYVDAVADFSIDILNPSEAGMYIVNVTKTIAGDVTVTLPGTSSPTIAVLTGIANSKFQLVITRDKFSDGAGGTVYIYVVTVFSI